MERQGAPVISAIIFFASIQAPGCFGIGFVVGEAIDVRNATTDTVLVNQPEELKKGQKVLVRTSEGLEYTGRFEEMMVLQPNAYWVKFITSDDTTKGVREAVGELLQVVHRMPGTGRIVGTTVGAAIVITSFVILIRGLTKTRLNDGYSGTLPFVP